MRSPSELDNICSMLGEEVNMALEQTARPPCPVPSTSCLVTRFTVQLSSESSENDEEEGISAGDLDSFNKGSSHP